MKGETVILTLPQRLLVEETVVKHCAIRKWELHAKNARTTHVHLVASISTSGEEARDQFKAWCTRHLNNAFGRRDWWSVGGMAKPIFDETYLVKAIRYVNEGQ